MSDFVKDTNVPTNELISRQAALDAVFDNAEHIDKAYEAIRALPSAQPMRPKGKWIQEELAYGGIPYHCDKCGVELWDTVLGTPRWNFCPNCGARMEGE